MPPLHLPGMLLADFERGNLGRHVNEEYPVNIIVEPGVANEVHERLPFAFTPPINGMRCILDLGIDWKM